MINSSIVADLRREGVVSVEEIRQAAAIYLADPACGPYRFQSGHVLDVAAAVAQHKPTVKALADPKMPAKNRPLLVQGALSLARTAQPSTAD